MSPSSQITIRRAEAADAAAVARLLHDFNTEFDDRHRAWRRSPSGRAG